MDRLWLNHASLSLLLIVIACAPVDRGSALLTLPENLDCRLGAREASPDRDRPAACALPDAATIARMCAVYDRVNTPGYDPQEDQAGNLVGEPPVPTYAANNAACDFIDASRNAATCRFSVAVPGENSIRPPVTSRFEFIRWRQDGPVSHMQGTMWIAREDCTPEIK